MRFPKPQPRVLERREEVRAAERQRRIVNMQVDMRDGYRCRACGQSADPKELDSVKRGHRHHLKFRSKGGNDTTENLLLLCAICHWQVHQHTLVIIGSDANKTLKFKRIA